MTGTVVVAGGGVAGLMLGCELGLAGVPAVVLEQAAAARTSSAGMLLHSRAYDALRRRGLGDRFRPEGTPTWPRTHFALLWLDLSGDLGRTDYDLVVPQWRTEQLLRERAAELGVPVRFGHRVTAVEQDAEGVDVTVRTASGEQVLRAAYLVGADGPDSVVAGLAGFEFDVLAPSYYGVIADVPVDPRKDHFHAGVFRHGQFGALPVNPADPGEVRLMTVEFGRTPAGPDTPVTAAELKASIRRITRHDEDFAEPRWIVRYGSETRLARRYREGRVLLAGDAAHPHPPSSGNGLVTALHDSVNLGWKLAAVLHGRAPAGLLDSYDRERRPVGRRACIRALAQIPLQHPPDQAEPLRELFADLLTIEAVNRRLVQYTTHVRYPMEDGAGPAAAHPLLGAPLPDAELVTAAGPVDAAGLFGTGHGLLLDLSGGRCASPDLARWAGRVDRVTADPVPALDAAVVLARPDGHVVHADRTGTDADGLLRALTRWFG